LACLTQKGEEITDMECKKEVFNTERMMANDFRSDTTLKEACKDDAATYCADVDPGMGRMHECLRTHRSQLKPECAAEELKLNIIQAADIRLRPGVYKECSEEIAVYCKKVQPGKGRLYRCLQNNMGKVDFSDMCRRKLDDKQSRQQSYYKLDFGVRSACSKDVTKSCQAENSGDHGQAAVLKCLVSKIDQLESPGCAKEVSRSVRMALWQFRKGAALTNVCDMDVETGCPNSSRNVGVVGQCLANLVATHKPVSEACTHIINVAAPADVKTMFDDEMTTAAVVHKVEEIERAAGMQAAFMQKDASGNNSITLTGWVALASLSALVVVIVSGSVYAYRKYTGQDKPYTLVVKGGDV